MCKQLCFEMKLSLSLFPLDDDGHTCPNETDNLLSRNFYRYLQDRSWWKIEITYWRRIISRVESRDSFERARSFFKGLRSATCVLMAWATETRKDLKEGKRCSLMWVYTCLSVLVWDNVSLNRKGTCAACTCRPGRSTWRFHHDAGWVFNGREHTAE